jgi:hypothetical protein
MPSGARKAYREDEVLIKVPGLHGTAPEVQVSTVQQALIP